MPFSCMTRCYPRHSSMSTRGRGMCCAHAAQGCGPNPQQVVAVLFHAVRTAHRTHDRTLVLTLSDPATRNTLSPQVYAAGVEALNVAEADDAVRCVVLRGDGAHFCSGGNLQRLAHNRRWAR